MRQELDRAYSQQQLEAWLLADLFDGDLTEVLIQERADDRDFEVVEWPHTDAAKEVA